MLVAEGIEKGGETVISLRMRRVTAFAFACAACLSAWVAAPVSAADLPTVSMEHLYFLQARGRALSELKSEPLINYLLALKLGGQTFQNANAQVEWIRVELARLVKIDMVPVTDPYIRWLTKALDVYSGLLREEAERVRDGIVREGMIATQTLETISRAQEAARAAEPK
jgi:hypothetical protein